MSEPVRYRNDPRIVAVVRLLISDIRRSVAPAVAEARFFESWDAIRADNSEAPAERCRRENAQALRIMAGLGNARGAALKAAERLSDDPSAHHRLSQRFRRLLREKK